MIVERKRMRRTLAHGGNMRRLCLHGHNAIFLWNPFRLAIIKFIKAAAIAPDIAVLDKLSVFADYRIAPIGFVVDVIYQFLWNRKSIQLLQLVFAECFFI